MEQEINMLQGKNMAYDGMALKNKLCTTKHPKGASPYELQIHGNHPSKMTSFKTDSQQLVKICKCCRKQKLAHLAARYDHAYES